MKWIILRNQGNKLPNERLVELSVLSTIGAHVAAVNV